MGNIHSFALWVFVVFYLGYVCLSVVMLIRGLRGTRIKMPITKLLRQSGRVNITLNGIAVTAVTVLSIYIMGKWILQQLLNGCMTIGWWNPACYDMNDFNRSWIAVFIVVGLNALLFTFVLDTKQQDKRLSR